MVLKKSRDARLQLHFWTKLLEGRMAMQKVVAFVRDLEKLRADEEETVAQDEKTALVVEKLLKCLVRLRATYRSKSQFCLSNQDTSSELIDELATNCHDGTLTRDHDESTPLREEIISRWCEKTRIGVIPKKGYVAMELPTLQLIQNSMRDKERLIKRTQLDRTSHLDDAYHQETFNDDDFYHQLLKEMISKSENSKWVEMQRTRYKTKRKADTRATKGRKIKKDLIPKLVNFMAPMRPMNVSDKEVVPDQMRKELLRSLFGGTMLSRSAAVQDE